MCHTYRGGNQEPLSRIALHHYSIHTEPSDTVVLKLHYDFYFSSQPALCAETSPATLFRDSKWDVQQLLPFAPTSSPPPSWHTGSNRRLSSCGRKWCQRLSSRHCNSSAVWMNTWRACWTTCSESDTMWKVTFVREVFIEFHHVDIYTCIDAIVVWLPTKEIGIHSPLISHWTARDWNSMLGKSCCMQAEMQLH